MTEHRWLAVLEAQASSLLADLEDIVDVLPMSTARRLELCKIKAKNLHLALQANRQATGRPAPPLARVSPENKQGPRSLAERGPEGGSLA